MAKVFRCLNCSMLIVKEQREAAPTECKRCGGTKFELEQGRVRRRGQNIIVPLIGEEVNPKLKGGNKMAKTKGTTKADKKATSTKKSVAKKAKNNGSLSEQEKRAMAVLKKIAGENGTAAFTLKELPFVSMKEGKDIGSSHKSYILFTLYMKEQIEILKKEGERARIRLLEVKAETPAK